MTCNQPSVAYRLIRTDRRTLALTLDSQGALIARAPKGMPLGEIERFIQFKTPWIIQKQAALQRQAAAVQACTLNAGAKLPYLGGWLTVAYGANPRPVAQGGVLYLPQKGDPLRHALSWFYQSAQRELSPRVERWARRMKVYPQSLAFGHAKGRWGSMTSTGAMRLNIALLHCPPEAIDYVIVHELAHRVHPDHSPAFHAYVESVLPGGAALRKQMKSLSGYLSLLRP